MTNTYTSTLKKRIKSKKVFIILTVLLLIALSGIWKGTTFLQLKTQLLAASPLGDLDNDGDIDMVDYNTLLANFGKTFSPTTQPNNTPTSLPAHSPTPGPTSPPGSASQITVAITSDSESYDPSVIDPWVEVLKLIKAENTSLMIETGDYWNGARTFADWSTKISTYYGGLTLGVATGMRMDPDRTRNQLGKYFYDFLTIMETRDKGKWGGCVGDVENLTHPDSYFRVPKSWCGYAMQASNPLQTGRGGDYWVRWKDIGIVSVNQYPNTGFIKEAFTAIDAAGSTPVKWKICAWHGNHLDFNVFTKGAAYDGSDHALPYAFYKACQDEGAIVVNGNSQQYSRTCVLNNIPDWKHGMASQNADGNPNRIERNPSRTLANHTNKTNCPNAGQPGSPNTAIEQLSMGPGKSIVFVTFGGWQWRDYIPNAKVTDNSTFAQDQWRADYSGWWSTIYANGRYCRNNCTKGDLSAQDRTKDVPSASIPGIKVDGAGALFLQYNYQGNSNKARGYYKTIDGQIVDEFILNYQP